MKREIGLDGACALPARPRTAVASHGGGRGRAATASVIEHVGRGRDVRPRLLSSMGLDDGEAVLPSTARPIGRITNAEPQGQTACTSRRVSATRQRGRDAVALIARRRAGLAQRSDSCRLNDEVDKRGRHPPQASVQPVWRCPWCRGPPTEAAKITSQRAADGTHEKVSETMETRQGTSMDNDEITEKLNGIMDEQRSHQGRNRQDGRETMSRPRPWASEYRSGGRLPPGALRVATHGGRAA